MIKNRCVRRSQILQHGVWNGEPIDGLTVQPDGRATFAGCRGSVTVNPGDVIVFVAGGLMPCSAMAPDFFEKQYETLE